MTLNAGLFCCFFLINLAFSQLITVPLEISMKWMLSPRLFLHISSLSKIYIQLFPFKIYPKCLSKIQDIKKKERKHLLQKVHKIDTYIKQPRKYSYHNGGLEDFLAKFSKLLFTESRKMFQHVSTFLKFKVI